MAKHALNGLAAAATIAAAAAVIFRLTAGPPLGELPPESQRCGIESWERYSQEGEVWIEPGAPVTVVVFSDYRCAHCGTAFEALAALQSLFPGQIDVIARPFPRGGADSYVAAAAAECARGVGRFDEMHSLLLERSADLGFVPWVDLAELAGISDLGSFTECLGGPWAESIIERSMLDATHLGARGTPTILINDLLLHGHPGERYLEAVVRDLLKER